MALKYQQPNKTNILLWLEFCGRKMFSGEFLVNIFYGNDKKLKSYKTLELFMYVPTYLHLRQSSFFQRRATGTIRIRYRIRRSA